MCRESQEKALALGFRPGDPNIALGEPINAAHGVDASQPLTLLELPDSGVITAVRNLWAANKKQSDITLVIDTSGSMGEQNKMRFAREGAARFINSLGEADRLCLMTFNSTVSVLKELTEVGPGRAEMLKLVGGLMPSGGTALYDAADAAHQNMVRVASRGRISALVILSDGADSSSLKADFDQLLSRLRPGPEQQGIRIFTIAYGSDAKVDVLERISTTTQGRAFKGTTNDIDRVFRDISTFF